VERGAARQIGSLAEDDVFPAEPREPIQDGGAADASADHDRASPIPHRVTLLGTSALAVRVSGA
jgi:hypothetical protein